MTLDGEHDAPARWPIAATIATALWLYALSYCGNLLSSDDRPTPPPPIDMRLVELPTAVAATSARADTQPPVSHAPALTRPQPQAPTRARHAGGRSTAAMAPSAVVAHETQREPPAAQADPAQSSREAAVPGHESNTGKDGASAPASAVRAEPAGRPAQVLSQPLPALPDDLREQAYQAVALARFIVHPDGAFDVELIRPTPYPRLNAILLDTLRTWRFSPATENGRAVESQRQVRVHFDVQ